MQAEHTREVNIADLFESSRDRLFRYALSLCKTIEQADDLIQETFLRAMANAQTLAGMNEYQRDAWLKRVLRNRFFDDCRARKRANDVAIEMIRHAKRPSGNTGLTEFGDILDRVPDRFRDVFEKRYRFGMNSTEIGRDLEIPAATVRSHLHQAIQWLRGEMTRSTPQRSQP